MAKDTQGYTLIELSLVILLIGIVMSLTVPRIRYTLLTDDLKRGVRRMVSTIKSLRNEAIHEHSTYYLNIDLETRRFWIESASMPREEREENHESPVSLPDGVLILDVWIKGEGKKTSGLVTIRFNDRGYVSESIIHMGNHGGRSFTLVLSPFLKRVKILEGYVESEETT